MSYDRDSLILANLELAQNIALREWRTATHALDKPELQSLAYFGLVSAAERWPDYCAEKQYDPQALQYFKVFASLRIRGAIRDFIRKEDWATRTLRSKAKLLKDAGQDEGLSVEELSDKTGLSIQDINKVMAKLAAKPVSLDAFNHNPDSEGTAFANNQIRDKVDTEGTAFANSMNLIFLESYAKLPVEGQLVLALHYYTKIDMRGIAEQLNMSETKVSDIHKAAVLEIREAMYVAASEE